MTRIGSVLWVVVIASMAADVALTHLGRQAGLVEVNPVARGLLRAHGTAGLVALKAAVVGLGVAFWTLLPARYSPIVPLSLAVPTVPAVVYNAVLVSAAVV